LQLVDSIQLEDQQIRALAVAHAGQILAVVQGNRVRLWDRKTKRVRGLIEANAIESVAFSPDERTIMTAGDHPFLLLWNFKLDAVALSRPQKAYSHDQTVSIDPAASKKRILIAGRDSLGFWDYAKQDKPQFFSSKVAGMNFAVISADGRFAAANQN